MCPSKFCKLHKTTPALDTFLVKLQAFTLRAFKKETPAQVLSCKVCETFKNIYFEEHLQTTASRGVL